MQKLNLGGAMLAAFLGAAVLVAPVSTAMAQSTPPIWRSLNAAAEGDFTMRNVTFVDGQTLPEVKIHYTTLGTPRRDASGRITNAVLMLHGSSGDASQTLTNTYAGALYGPGQALDVNEYFIILPDAVGNGRSTKPSDGLRGAFPKYGYADSIELHRRLVTEHFGIQKLRLLMGMSMGGMQAWMMGYTYPDLAQGIISLSSLPTKITGRNLLWRRILSDSVRNDPAWQNGNYEETPQAYKTSMAMFDMLVQSPVAFERSIPDIPAAEEYIEELHEETEEEDDANNVLWRFESSFDYDPKPADLAKITAPILSILFADDELNPIEIPVIEQAVRSVPNGHYIIKPAAPGHFAHRGQVQGALFAEDVRAFLASTATPAR